MKGSLDTPRVFVSYSWTSPQHEQWVLEIAHRLMGDGVHVVLDKWDLKEGQDKHKFMERMVNDTQINKVLVVCDSQYELKANSRKGGVGTESQLISKEVYENTEQEKFIPIVKEYKNKKPCIPNFMASRIYIDLSDENTFEIEYEKLIRNLFGKPNTKKPPLGSAPAYILDQEENPSKAVQQMQLARKKASVKLTSNKNGNLADFLDGLYSDLEKQRISYNNDPEYDEKVIKSIGKLSKLRDVFIDYSTNTIRHSANIDLDAYKTFFEDCLKLMQRPTDTQRWSEIDFDNFKFFFYELFLYFIALLLRERKYTEASFFIYTNYFYKGNGELQYGGIWLFNRYASSLEKIRNKRLELRRVSLMADLTKERATRQDINFEEIKQVDLILHVITSLNASDGETWFPRTSVYRSKFFGEQIEIFQKMISADHFNKVKVLMKIASKEELVDKVENYKQAVQNGNIRIVDSWNYNIPSISKIFKLDNIASIE